MFHFKVTDIIKDTHVGMSGGGKLLGTLGGAAGGGRFIADGSGRLGGIGAALEVAGTGGGALELMIFLRLELKLKNTYIKGIQTKAYRFTDIHKLL